jgi:hypothetical protein
MLVALGALAWLLAREAKPRGGAHTSAASAPELEPRAPTPEFAGEREPASQPPSAAAPAATGELEPFAAAPGTSPPSARRGSLRGHVETEGESTFPLRWRLVLRPSTTLPQRERALSRVLEFEDGRQEFALADLPLAGYDVFAEAEGFNGQVAAVLLEPGNEHPFVNLLLVPAGVLEGRVLDARGLAAEGVPVTLVAGADNHAREAVSGPDGAFRFDGVLDGAYELVLGRASAPLVRERHALRFRAPHLTFPDLVLPPLGEVHVRVVDGLERPLEGVLVRGSGKNGGVIDGRTDFDGRYVAKHLPAGTFRIRLQHPGLDPEFARRIAVDVLAGEIVEAPVQLGP